MCHGTVFKHSITNLPRDWGPIGFWLLSLLLHASSASAEGLAI